MAELFGLEARCFLTQEIDSATGGRVQSCDSIQECGLPGPVGSDEPNNFTLFHAHRYPIDCHEAAEPFGDFSGFKDAH